jgi:hypothetical protein
MLAMISNAPRVSRFPASSLTSIATVRRFDMLAPTENLRLFEGQLLRHIHIPQHTGVIHPHFHHPSLSKQPLGAAIA